MSRIMGDNPFTRNLKSLRQLERNTFSRMRLRRDLHRRRRCRYGLDGDAEKLFARRTCVQILGWQMYPGPLLGLGERETDERFFIPGVPSIFK